MPSEKEQADFDELNAWTLSLRDPEFIHQHVVNAFALQHATTETKHITIAFALIGLYLHFEKGFSGRQVQMAHIKMAQPHGRGSGRKDWPRFPLPAQRGAMTARDVLPVAEAQRASAVEKWCRSVWEAWSDTHAAVREWAERELTL